MVDLIRIRNISKRHIQILDQDRHAVTNSWVATIKQKLRQYVQEEEDMSKVQIPYMDESGKPKP